jgi:hypothetical protein
MLSVIRLCIEENKSQQNPNGNEFWVFKLKVIVIFFFMLFQVFPTFIFFFFFLVVLRFELRALPSSHALRPPTFL